MKASWLALAERSAKRLDFESQAFFLRKVSPEPSYDLALCYFHQGQFERCIQACRSGSPTEIALVVKCRLSVGDFEGALRTIESVEINRLDDETLKSALLCHKGDALVAIESAAAAKICFLGAFESDRSNVSAWEKFKLLATHQEVHKACLNSPIELRYWLAGDGDDDDDATSNPDSLSRRAMRCLENGDVRKAKLLSSKARSRDPFHREALLTTIVALTQSGESERNALFKLAHELVEKSPKDGYSWFAVACYYSSIGSYDDARHHFHKATLLEPQCVSAWLGFGHAFAFHDESDPCMAAYRTASRLFPGSHWPLLFTATEYIRTHNPDLAERYAKAALTRKTNDPHAANELGVAYFRKKDFSNAKRTFEKCISNLESAQDNPYRAQLLIASRGNLGHTLRKLQKLEKAFEQFSKALDVSKRFNNDSNQQASLLSAMGWCRHGLDDLTKAIELYHQSLHYRRDDTVTLGLLERAVEEMSPNSLAKPY